MKKTIKYIFYSTLGIVLSTLLLALLVFNSNTFQTWLTTKTTNYLSAQFKTKITIDHIKYLPFTGFALDNVYWGDQKNDTLFFVDELHFNLGGWNEKTLKLTLNDVVVNGGYCKIVTYPDSTFNIDVLFNIFEPYDTIPDTISPPFQLYFNRVACHNTRFKLIDSTTEFETQGFDGLNQDFSNIEILARDFWIIDDSLHFDLKKLSCIERSGIEVKQAKTIATICNKAMLFDSLELKTNYSSVSNTFHMFYQNWDELSDFNHKVKMIGKLTSAKVDMHDLQHFASALNGNNQHFEVNGDISGTVDNLKIKTMDISFGAISKLNINGTIKGLPEVDETFIDIKTNEITTCKVDLERLITIGLPEEILRLGTMKFKGRYTGFYNDFVAYGKFQTALGNGACDMNMKLGDSITIPSYSGKLSLTHFNLGKLLDQPTIGKTSFTTTVNGKGFDLHNIESKIDAKVEYVEANNYSYKLINLGGEFKHKMFQGRFDMLDEHAEVHFDGTVDLNKEIPLYKFKATIDYADLKALHFDTANLVLSTTIDINFSIKNIDNNEGEINLNKTLFIKNGIDYPIENIKLHSTINGTQKSLQLNSDMLSAHMHGEYNFSNMASTFQKLSYQLAPQYFKTVNTKTAFVENFKFDISILDTRILSDLFFPSSTITGAHLLGKVNTIKNEFELNGTIDEITYNQYILKKITTAETIRQETGEAQLHIASIENNDSLIANLLNIKTVLKNNRATTSIVTFDSLGIINTNLNALTQFSNNNIVTTFNSSVFSYKYKSISIADNSQIQYSSLTQKITVNQLQLFNETEKLAIDGFYIRNKDYNFSFELENVNISMINLIYPQVNIQVKGNANGKIAIKGDNNNTVANTFLTVNSVIIDNDSIGDFTLTSNYDEQQKRFISYLKSIDGKLKNLELGGYIDTRKAPYEVNFSLVFNESDLRSFQALIKDEATIYYGKISARCKLTGNLNQLVVEGDINLNQVLTRVEYLKTMYGFNAKISLSKNTITVNPFQITDINGKKATVDGAITHQSFSNFLYNINITELNEFQILNTTAKDNSLFYGKAFVTGQMSIKGPQNDLVLDARLKSSKGTVFSIPLSDNGDEDGDELLNFINKDSTIKSVNMIKKSSLIGFGINMYLTITPDAQIQLVFDEVQDDKIIGTGKGTLKMELTKQGVFSMFGEVAIENGEYNFTAVDVFTRKFMLNRGGTITWTGDPFQAKMNIQGVYKVRSTSVANIITTSTEAEKQAASQQRVPVECLLKLKGNLLNPDISFDLNFPDNTNLLGNNVSALDNSLRRLRNEPELMQQQVVSLLLFGKFAPVQGNNQEDKNSNFNSGLTNTLSDLISAQASNLLSKYIPGFDVRAEYQAAISSTQGNRAMVTASKRFLNERLEVQTSFDVLGINGNFTGHIMGQYSLRSDGNLKLRGFNKTTNNPLYSKNITSQGVGLYYRKEFDSFSDILKRKNSKKFPPNF